MLARVEEVLKKNDRLFQLDKALRVGQEIHTGLRTFTASVESGLTTVQAEPAFAAFRRLYTGPVTDAGIELEKALDAMIDETQAVHERPSLASEELKEGEEAKDEKEILPIKSKTA